MSTIDIIARLKEQNIDINFYQHLIEELLTNPSIFIDKKKFSRQFNCNIQKIDSFFETLEKTDIGERVYQFPLTSHKFEMIEHFKFYFYNFNYFNNIAFRPDQEGALLEQKFFSELKKKFSGQVYTFRTKENLEIDFILQRNLAINQQKIDLIEIKKDQFIYAGDFANMLLFDKEISIEKELFVLHNGMRDKKEGKIFVIPIEKYLNEFI